MQALQAQLAELKQQAASTPPVALIAALTPAAAGSVPTVPDVVATDSDSAPAQAALAAETAKSPSGSPVAPADVATADDATASPAAATAAPPTATGRLPGQV